VDPHSLALAYALSTIAGLRASLTVLAVAVAIHVHAIAAPAAMPWLASDATLAVAAIFAVADFFADKIPVVDHAVHLVHVVLAPAAGGIAAAGVDPSSSGAMAAVAVLGGANALGVLGLRATTRAGSTAFSGGLLNAVVSIAEDAVAVAGIIVAFMAPVAMACVALVLTLAFVLLARAALRRGRRPVSP
jgi:hypothetical protein